MSYKYTDILNEYGKAIKEFGELTDINIDIHEMRFRQNATINTQIINEGIYLMFKEGMALADKYLNGEQKNKALLEEIIEDVKNKEIHRYAPYIKPDNENKKKRIMASNVIDDAHTAFYKGAEYRINNPTKKEIHRADFGMIISAEERHI